MWRLALQLKADKAIDVLKGLKTKVAQMKSEEQQRCSSCTRAAANQTQLETLSFANEEVSANGMIGLAAAQTGTTCQFNVAVDSGTTTPILTFIFWARRRQKYCLIIPLTSLG